MRNSANTHRQAWITAYRVVSPVLLVAILVITIILLVRPAPKTQEVPTTAEIAQAINGPATFERPSNMEYVAKTNSCVVGGTVTYTKWVVGAKSYPVDKVNPAIVDYTVFGFKSDQGRQFDVYANDALFNSPGGNLGLELQCDQKTMGTAKYFEMLAIIYGGA